MYLMVWKGEVSGRNSYSSFIRYLANDFLSNIIFINHALFLHVMEKAFSLDGDNEMQVSVRL